MNELKNKQTSKKPKSSRRLDIVKLLAGKTIIFTRLKGLCWFRESRGVDGRARKPHSAYPPQAGASLNLPTETPLKISHPYMHVNGLYSQAGEVEETCSLLGNEEGEEESRVVKKTIGRDGFHCVVLWAPCTVTCPLFFFFSVRIHTMKQKFLGPRTRSIELTLTHMTDLSSLCVLILPSNNLLSLGKTEKSVKKFVWGSDSETAKLRDQGWC